MVGVKNFAFFVKFYNSFGKEMNFSTFFTINATLTQEIGATDLWVCHKKLANFM
jgi:hypothetical protein